MWYCVEVTGVESKYSRFETWAFSFTSTCLGISEEKQKVVGHLYMVSMPGEVKYSTQEMEKTWILS